MAKSARALIVTIQWGDTHFVRERLRLDTATVQTAKRLHTTEEWGDTKRWVNYQPRVTRCKKVGRTLVLTLRYLPSEHPDLRDIKGVIWGETTLRIPGNHRQATATWKTIPDNSDYDGTVSCKIEVEQPTAFAVLEKKARRDQERFKSALMKLGRGGQCELTRERAVEVLDAAHVRPAARGGPSTINNGLILRTDLHRLYDAGLFAFDTKGYVRYSQGLSVFYRKLLSGKRLNRDALLRVGSNLAYQAAATRKGM